MLEILFNTSVVGPRLRGGFAVLLIGLVGVLASCAPIQKVAPEPDVSLSLTRTTFADLVGWGVDNHADALDAFRRSCRRLINVAPQETRVGGIAIAKTAWRKTCDASFRVRPGDGPLSKKFFERNFTPFAATAGQKQEGLFTGYYEAALTGAREKTDAYAVPLYGPPEDMVTVDLGLFDKTLAGRTLTGRVDAKRVVPLPDRAAIDAGALEGEGLELLWVSSAEDAFFLHVQGSGRVEFEDGSAQRVGFAGRNGHAYTAIGRVLIDRGEIAAADMSMQAIREWIRSNPDRAQDLMAENKSYIFFRFLDGDGPVGASGVELTPARSIAIDPAHMPYGLPVWLQTVDPVETDRPLNKLLVTQDTGAAIKGPIRGDVFWGHGADAATRAGQMKSEGRLYVLLPKAN